MVVTQNQAQRDVLRWHSMQEVAETLEPQTLLKADETSREFCYVSGRGSYYVPAYITWWRSWIHTREAYHIPRLSAIWMWLFGNVMFANL